MGDTGQRGARLGRRSCHARPPVAQNDLVCREGSRAWGQDHAGDGPQALGQLGVFLVTPGQRRFWR